MQKNQTTKIQTQKAPKDVSQYLQDLESLLKRNTGSNLFQGQDTSSNTPMYIPGRVENPTGLTGSAPSIEQYGNGMTQPEPVSRENPVVYQDQQQQQNNQNQQSQLDSFFSKLDSTYGDPSLPTSSLYMKSSPKLNLRTSQNMSPIMGRGMFGGLSGVNALSMGLFGQNQDITQQFGNYNPGVEPGSGYNLGTDFRTRNLSGSRRELKLPVSAEVVQVFQDDGTRFGNYSGHQGYGNSLLLRLPSGEMIRTSHLSAMANVRPGDIIEPGQVFGIPGQTGNTYGEHLDLEYYQPGENRPSDPNNFTGWRDPNSFLQQNTQQTQQPQEDTNFSQMMSPIRQVNQQPQENQQPFNSYTPATDAISSVAKPVGQTAQTIGDILKSPDIGTGVNKAGRALSDVGVGTQYGNSPEGFLGLGELAGGNLPAAGKEFASTIERVNPTGTFDTGLSELLSGNVPLAKEKFAGSLSRVENRLARIPQQFSREVVKPAYADDGTAKPQETLGQNISGAIDSVKQYVSDKGQTLSQAGQGIKSLGQSGVSTLESLFSPKQEITKRAIGDVSGTADQQQSGQFSSLMDGSASMTTPQKGDTRDPFFKMGGSEMYKDYVKPNAQDLFGGALNMGIFNDNFYSDLGRISSVFGGSKDLGAATEKYVDKERAKYPTMNKMGYSSEYDNGSIDEYNRGVDEYNNALSNYFNQIRSSVSGSDSIFKPVQSSAKNMVSRPSASMVSRPSVSFTSMMSRPAATFSAPRVSTPQKSSINYSPIIRSSSPSTQTSAPKSMPAVNKSMPAVNKSIPAKAPAPKSMPAVNKSMPAVNKSTPQSKPSSNIFSKVSAPKSTFRR